jgi:predicted Ser/Thr protein kinase
MIRIAQQREPDAESALVRLGIVERPRAIAGLGGGRSNAVYRVELAERTLVLKLSVGTVLTLVARCLGSQPFARGQGQLANARLISPAGRRANEARGLAVLARAGIRVPRVIASDPRTGLLLVEHIDGVPLPSILVSVHVAQRIAGYAHALRAVHAAGVTLGDCHPGNALVGPDGRITLIDLEHAELDSAAGTLRVRPRVRRGVLHRLRARGVPRGRARRRGGRRGRRGARSLRSNLRARTLAPARPGGCMTRS